MSFVRSIFHIDINTSPAGSTCLRNVLLIYCSYKLGLTNEVVFFFFFMKKKKVHKPSRDRYKDTLIFASKGTRHFLMPFFPSISSKITLASFKSLNYHFHCSPAMFHFATYLPSVRFTTLTFQNENQCEHEFWTCNVYTTIFTEISRSSTSFVTIY